MGSDFDLKFDQSTSLQSSYLITVDQNLYFESQDKAAGFWSELQNNVFTMELDKSSGLLTLRLRNHIIENPISVTDLQEYYNMVSEGWLIFYQSYSKSK